MASEKIFDRADLLRIFQDVGPDAQVGKVTVIAPSPTLFGETTTEHKPIEAHTVAYWCERYALCIVVQSIDFVEGGTQFFAKEHPLRAGRKVTVKYGSGDQSARLMRWVIELADEYRSEVAGHIPTEPIDLRHPSDAAPTATVYVNDEPIGTIDLSLPVAEIDDDHTPTGITVDNPFDDEDDE